MTFFFFSPSFHCSAYVLVLGFPGRVSVSCIVWLFFSGLRQHLCAPGAMTVQCSVWNVICSIYRCSFIHSFPGRVYCIQLCLSVFVGKHAASIVFGPSGALPRVQKQGRQASSCRRQCGKNIGAEELWHLPTSNTHLQKAARKFIIFIYNLWSRLGLA